MTTSLTDEQVADAVQAEVAQCTIGFLKFGTDALGASVGSAGSGTLVKVGSKFGVLTAAHVIEALPCKGQVGVVQFNHRTPVQKQTIEMADADLVTFHVPANKERGPDIGFLRLPEMNVANFKATHRFLDLERLACAEEPGPPFLDWVVVVVSEWTEDVDPIQPLHPESRPLRKTQFQAALSVGKAESPRTENDFDLFDLVPALPSPPSSYGGVSGGAVRRVYINEIGENQYLMRGNRLIGVPFYELEDNNGSLRLVCHGPNSIYERLRLAIDAYWAI